MSDEEEEICSETSSVENSTESDDDIIQDMPDKDFFKTLSCLKNRDPRIYDSSVQFFTEPPIVIKNKSKHEFNDGSNDKSIEDNVNSFKNQHIPREKTFTPTKTKFSLNEIDDDSGSEDELIALKQNQVKSQKEESQTESEYIQFLKGRNTILEDKRIEEELKPLQSYWNTDHLDEGEQFLKDYILNRKYLEHELGLNADIENLSEDERELEEQEEYEHNYNFRFENEENLKIKRFPRNVEGSLRRKNDARSKKRAELAKRKKEVKEKKYQEIKKKQKEKLSQIEDRLQKLKELTGNEELGFKDEEILEDFDPVKHDQKMNELFDEDYYSKEDDVYPFSNDTNYWEDDDNNDYDNIDMDCEEEIEKTKKLTRSQKKKLRKKKSYQDLMAITKPSFDPNVHKDFKKYLDEYYSLDCEDFIDDIPCKFKYRDVVPNDYGLSIEEILMADDKELNRWASVKKLCKRRPEHVEKNEVKIYKMKARDGSLKRKILKSLYSEDQENEHDNSGKGGDISDQECNGTILHDIDNKFEDSSNIRNEGSIVYQTKKTKRNKFNNDYSATDSVTGKGKTIFNSKDVSLQETEFDSDVKRASIENIEKTEIAESNYNENNTIIPNKKKQRKKKKRKKHSNMQNNDELSRDKKDKNHTACSDSNQVQSSKDGNIGNKKRKSKNKKKINNKFVGKFGINKNRRGNTAVNLSDSRLIAYGIKPKQFRAKMIYSQN